MTRRSRAAAPAAGLPQDVLRRRWDLVVPHRDALFAVARRRTDTRQDAEDAVATALLRAVEHPGLDESRVGAFLNTTVIRLTADAHRGRGRQSALQLRLSGRAVPAVPFEEAVCDRDEARWLARALADAPERELQILQARASGLSPRQAQDALGLTPKAAENAYTRVRHRARGLLASTLVAAGLSAAGLRRLARSAAVGVPALALATLAVTLPHPPAPTPAPGAESPTAAAAPAVVAAVPGTPAPSPAAPAAQSAALARPAPADAAAPPARPPSGGTAGRTTVTVPPVGGPLAPEGGVYVERKREDETFQESLQYCLDNVPKVVADPTTGPCD